MADNKSIARQFSLLASLMELYGENSFKARSYANAAFAIKKLPIPLSDLPREKIANLNNIGASTAGKIIEILERGTLAALEEYVERTPRGILELLSVKGVGPKKLAVIWKEMDIESPGELLHACTENRLTRYKGFGEKTQKSIEEAVQFFLSNQGSRLYAELELYAQQSTEAFRNAFPDDWFEITGKFRRQLPVVDRLEWVTTVPVTALQLFFAKHGFTEEEIGSGSCLFRSPENILIAFYSRTKDLFWTTLFETSCSETFLEAWRNKYSRESSTVSSESEIFERSGLPFIPAFLREKPEILVAPLPLQQDIIQPSDIRGIIHSHSTWSDGSHSLEQMASACIEQGYEYMVISDHSKAAAYAQGLTEDRVLQQHRQIDELNARLAPFKIFKSIEADILGDGSLDYSEEFLSRFDLVIASVHSNLKMPEEKAMARLLRAIGNPHTRILGHMTGRLLLSRPGYPVNFATIIDACAAHGVVIEINANPRRLDMDWEWIPYALSKNVLLSINPDAHDIREYANCRYGVLAAQKGGLTTKSNLSSFSLAEFEAFLQR